MSYRRVFQIALVVLTGALVACSGDQTNPTAPDLGSLASLTSEAKPTKCPTWPDCPDDGGGGGGSVSYNFEVSWVGDVNSRGGTATATEKLDSSWLGVFFQPSGLDPNETEGMDLSFFETTITGGTDCFSNIINIVIATVGEVKKNPDRSDASHSFHAFGTNGEAASYELLMVGNVPWGLPNLSESATFTFTSWELVVPKGPRYRNSTACTGTGSFMVDITVTNLGEAP